MSPHRPDSATAEPTSARTPDSSGPARVGRACFYVLVAVLCTRPLIGESYERLELSFLTVLPTIGGPTPATTAWLDLVLLVAALPVLTAWPFWRRHRTLMLGTVLLVAAVIVSSWTAHNRYLATFAGSSLLVTVLAGFALFATEKTPAMCSVLIAAWLATGVTTAARCVRQATTEFADLRQAWEQEYKPTLIRAGFDADDPVLVNYERRLLSREVHGFLGHPNVTGSCLVVWLVLLASLTLASAVTRGNEPQALRLAMTALAMAGCVLLTGALWLTGSRGAIGAALAGLAAFAALGGLKSLRARPARAAGLFFGIYVALAGATVAWGVRHGTLPHASLAFRWQYWTTAARVYAHTPLTGIGRLNFAAAYLRWKAPESTEEVRDPHNLWVSLLVELGPLGLAGGVLLVVATVVAVLARTRDWVAPAPPPARALAAVAATRSRLLEPSLVTAGLVLLLHILFSGTPFGYPGVWLIWLADIAFVWTLAFALGLWVVGRVNGDPRGRSWLAAGLSAALLAALVHGLVDLALMTAGGLAVVVVCAAAGASVAAPPYARHERPGARRRLGVRCVLGASVVLLHLVTVVIPVHSVESRVQRLQALLRDPATDPQHAYDVAAGLAARPCSDPSAWRVALRAVYQLAQHPYVSEGIRIKWLRAAERSARELIDRYPRDTANFTICATLTMTLAQTCAQAGATEEARQLRRAAAEAWDQAVKLYPTNPRTRLSAGAAWLMIWQQEGDQAAAQRAAAHFREALRIDDLRPPHEVARLRPRERAAAEENLAQLAAPATGPS